jgi:predicted transcriptional regulator
MDCRMEDIGMGSEPKADLQYQAALDDQYRRMIEEGLRDIEAGRVIPHNEAMAIIRTWSNKN